MGTYTLKTEWNGRWHNPGHTQPRYDATIVLVGCGGTGGFLATAIARLLMRRQAQLFLVDPDRVGPENLGRQAFSECDLGKFKAQVLAERIAREFAGLAVGYSVLPYNSQLHQYAFSSPAHLALIVGAVDNAAARRSIAAELENSPVWWLDAGNGYASGQVLLGNVASPERLRNAFDAEQDACYLLPAPSLQRPDLLDAPPQPAADPANCAAAVERAEQSATINQSMAAIAASYVERLLDGTCTWMATYVDMENGTVQSVAASPEQVARGVGKSKAFLVATARRAA